jgi:hypothetical protein
MPTSLNVLVLGAGPDAVIPRVDSVYTANTAIGWYANKIMDIPRKIAVVSSYELSPRNRSSENELSLQYIRKFDSIRHAFCDRLVTIHSDQYPEGVNDLRASGYLNPIKKLSVQDCRVLQKSVSGVQEPVFSWEYLMAHRSIKGAYSLCKSAFLASISIYDSPYFLIPSLFRPSTGIIALLYAISQHGADSQYFISGISMKTRNAYANGESTILKELDNWRLAPHILADRKILRALKKRYNIVFL